MNGKFEPPHITGATTVEQLRQINRYLWNLTEQLNMELDQLYVRLDRILEEKEA